MNQKEIKELIASDEKRLEDAKEGYKLIPEHQQIKVELEAIEKKRAELQNKLYQIEIKYREDHKGDIDFAYEELRYSRELLRKAQAGLDPKDFNDELVKMYKSFYNGSTYSSEKKLQWVSDDGKYAIFKVNSHSAYVDRMTKVVSAEAEWHLFHIISEFDEKKCSYDMSDLRLWKKEGGRWGESRDMKTVQEVIHNYENNDFMSQFMKDNGFELINTNRSRPYWENKNIVIKYTTTRTPQMGFDKGKTFVENHERFCTLQLGNDYYVGMPENEEQFKNKYPDVYEEIKKSK
ncbi:MAG: hypothetical protein AABY15_00435 [Nanoarchaeota archaeon]